MALAIRMARGGAKKRPYYRIVVADSRSPRDGRYIEKIGTYNPLLAKDDDNRVKLDKERAKYWLDEGARPSDRVQRFLADAGLQKPVKRNNPNKGKPGAKALERIEAQKEKEEAAKAAAEEASKAASEEEAAPTEEAPKEEVAKEEKAEEAKPEEAASEETAKEEKAADTDEKKEESEEKAS